MYALNPIPLTAALCQISHAYHSRCNFKFSPAMYLKSYEKENNFFYSCFRPFLDIDECANDQHSCHPLAKCSNTEGSYSCSCVLGYQGDGILQCEGAYIYYVISALE